MSLKSNTTVVTSELGTIYAKGIGGNFLKLIKDMYSNTLYSCKFRDSYSEPFLTTLGVKQGDSLSPHCSTYLWTTLSQVLLTTHKLNQ